MAVKYLSFDDQSSSKYSAVNRVFSGPADQCHFSNSLSSSSPGAVIMITRYEAMFIDICLEGFFYGKIFVPCALTCILTKEV